MSRIAIVDDSRLVRAFAAGALRAKGHDTVEIEPTSLVRGAEGAPGGSRWTCSWPISSCPGCPGESLVRACREDAALRDLPILVVSAHRDDISMQRMQQMGISGFLMKPVDASALVAKVAEALAE